MKCQQLGEYTERIDRTWIMRAAAENALHLALLLCVAFYRLIVRLKQPLVAFLCKNDVRACPASHLSKAYW